jgi:hypothetical protein
MGRRVPGKVTGLGLVLFVAGLTTFIAVQRWMDTRIVRPVDMPVSLVAGHIRTGPFRLNLKTSYWVTVDPGAWWSTGRACADQYPRLLTRPVLYQQGNVIDMRVGKPPTSRRFMRFRASMSLTLKSCLTSVVWTKGIRGYLSALRPGTTTTAHFC